MADHLPADRTPVLVAIGEVTFRPATLTDSRDPVALMVDAVRDAERDAGFAFAGDIDSVDVVSQYSWSYADAARSFCQRLGIDPPRAVYGVAGGESPVRHIHAAAVRIATGSSRACLVVGAESQHSATRAERSGEPLPWPPAVPENTPRIAAEDIFLPMSMAYNMVQPVIVYPFYENATTVAWGQTPAEAVAESGRLWSRYTEVASGNPFAWNAARLSPAAITTPTADNRIIAWPYTKHMVANPSVNQAAAVLVTSLAWARAHGIPENRLAYIVDGAAAMEPRDILQRDNYTASPAQDVVLEHAMAANGGRDFTHRELYSCFPVVPKLARRRLGLDETATLTVTGGLPFFGAPLNNYMTHAACAMVRALRRQPGTGLLYGQGEFVTKHHALVLSSEAPDRLPTLVRDLSDAADARRGGVPELAAAATGRATLESFTVVHDRAGQPDHGIVILRTDDNRRTVALVPGSDVSTITRLEALDASPIGLSGNVHATGDGRQAWAVDEA